jgi:peroxiredoxin Q/BCP
MSKKTRKKSSNSPASRKARAPARTAAAGPALKSEHSPAKKSGKNERKKQTNARPQTSKASKPSTAASANRKTAARGVVGEGEKAPSFHLPRDGGNTVSLADFAGQKLVLFFYPRADTPGCTREAIDFTRLKDAFAAAGTAVVGVSADEPKAQDAFRNKHQLAVPLASDEKHEMLAAYGAWGEKSMYGRTFMGILRTTVLIGTDGRIIRVWRNVRVDGHAEEVLAAARSA